MRSLRSRPWNVAVLFDELALLDTFANYGWNALWVELGIVLYKSRDILDHRMEHRASFFDVSLGMFLLQVFELLGHDNSIALCEFEIKLEVVSSHSNSDAPTRFVLFGQVALDS